MKRHISIVVAALLATSIFLFNCEKQDDGYVTHGKVYMDKLVTLDSLYNNWKEFKGKLVTIKVGEVLGGSVTEIRPVDGIDCQAAIQWPVNIHGLKSNDDYVNFAEGKFDPENPPTYFDFGSYYLRFMSCNKGISELPKWIDYKGKIYSDYKKDEIGTDIHGLMAGASESKEKFVSGIFVDIYPRTRLIEELRVEDQIKATVFVLTGIRFLPPGKQSS